MRFFCLFCRNATQNIARRKRAYASGRKSTDVGPQQTRIRAKKFTKIAMETTGQSAKAVSRFHIDAISKNPNLDKQVYESHIPRYVKAANKEAILDRKKNLKQAKRIYLTRCRGHISDRTYNNLRTVDEREQLRYVRTDEKSEYTGFVFYCPY